VEKIYKDIRKNKDIGKKYKDSEIYMYIDSAKNR